MDTVASTSNGMDRLADIRPGDSVHVSASLRQPELFTSDPLVIQLAQRGLESFA